MAAVSANLFSFPPVAAEPEDEIIGANRGLREAVASIRLVAPTEATVMILGETGTGKEVIARSIHQWSRRSRAPFVKVNCAAIPAALLESELFGHERGAFTGAITQTTGRFQLAHTGTLFLDEIGDLPLELQPKLLRVLQEQEFERLGSTRTIRVDVRIVAATNQNLQQLVQQRRFRADLYYRLNVFPVTLPPLRDRVADIPDLARHFARVFACRMNCGVKHISEQVMDSLCHYDWPGNIRELQNIIERAVVLSSGQELFIPAMHGERRRSAVASSALPRTLAEAERSHILNALQQAQGVVGGRNGAASRLGMPRTTLISRMQKLGIGPEASGSAMSMPAHA